ncbi:hypothetical protein [Nocardioides pantholopis]|uniref:hypothetical protein n=1 Tax=Nocardioides pantholopis TaxID=2483798 RepID=UPI000F076ECB|nr:hypothetical protein [Nocardioides pantholopis]
MRDGQRRLSQPHYYHNPALTLTSSAPPEAAMAALVDALVDARFRLQESGPGRARLRAGSWLRDLVFDPMDVAMFLPRRFATWGFVATVDLETLDTPAATQVRVRMHRMSEPRFAVPHILDAVDAAVRALSAAGHDAVAGEVGHGP